MSKTWPEMKADIIAQDDRIQTRLVQMGGETAMGLDPQRGLLAGLGKQLAEMLREAAEAVDAQMDELIAQHGMIEPQSIEKWQKPADAEGNILVGGIEYEQIVDSRGWNGEWRSIK